MEEQERALKFAAIDIGSNAIRLLLSQVYDDNGDPIIKKESLVRIPIRLGEDAFLYHNISDQKIDQLVNSLIGFKYLMDAYQPIDFMACATSAMREAINGKNIAEIVKEKAGIDLNIISGKQEADIIYSNNIEKILDKDKTYLYIDVGGGSTELTFFKNKEIIDTRSLDLGTIRILNNLITKKTWKEAKYWVKDISKELGDIYGIGSGGNINKLFSMARQKEGKPLSRKKISEISTYIKKFSYNDRIRYLKMRKDRADVIVPALEIYLSVMKWAKIEWIFVPQIGLSDGIINVLYEKYKSEQLLQK